MQVSVLFSNNGPQFNLTTFKEFFSLHHFQHITSSPWYPQSNGLAERTVKTVKALFTGTLDLHLALLSYRATLLPWCSISPAEVLFGRTIATNLPQPDAHLSPDRPYLKTFQQADSAHKSKQQTQFNHGHCTRSLPELPLCTPVWVKTGKQQEPGQIITKTMAPRSYIVKTASGRKHRNRHHLAPRLDSSRHCGNNHFRFDLQDSHTVSPESFLAAGPSVDAALRSPIRICSMTGTAIRLLRRYT